MPKSFPTYLTTYSFPSQEIAGRACQESQQALQKAEDCNLSIFRVEINRKQHIIVLGDPPPARLLEKLNIILAPGTPTTVPPSVIETLAKRANERQSRGTVWFERHYRR